MSLKKTILYFTMFYLLALIRAGIYYEDMTDVFISVMSRGILTTKPVAIFNNYTAHFAINHLYTYLYQLYPAGWYGILNLVFQYLSLLNTFIFCYNVLQKLRIKYKWLLFFIIAAYLTNDIIFLQYTKTSIFLICSSLLNLMFYHHQRKQVSSGILFANAFFFILGILLRPQVFYLSVLSLFPFLLINRKKIFSVLTVNDKIIYSCVLIISITILTLFNNAFTETDKKYAVFSKYKSSVWDGKQPDNTLNLQTAADSTIYYSFQNYFFPDIHYINSAYLNKFGILKAHTPLDFILVNSKHISFRLKTTLTSLHTILKNENYKLYLLASLIMLLLYLSMSSIAVFLKVCVQLAWSVIFLFLITLFLKMENRILFPVLFFSSLSALFYFNDLRAKNSTVYHGFLLVNIISCLFYIYGNMFIYKKRYSGQQEINQFLSQISDEKTKHTYILDVFTLNLLGNNVLESSLYKNNINWYSFDAGYLIFYDEYIGKSEQTFGAATLKECILNIQKNNQNVIFIYSPERLALLKDYVKTIYNIDMEFYKTNHRSYINYPIFGNKIIINSYSLKSAQ